jgi:hypothetical protein
MKKTKFLATTSGKLIVSLGISTVGLIPAYLTSGMGPMPYQTECILFAVYCFLFLEANAAAGAPRSLLPLWLSVLCGVTFYYGMLFQKHVSWASVYSAIYVVVSTVIALRAGSAPKGFLLGESFRMLIIFPVSLWAAHWIADMFPYMSTEMQETLVFGFAVFGLEHILLSIYDWGKLKPGSFYLRITAIIGGSLGLVYYTGYDQSYYYNVVFAATLVIDNAMNIAWDGLQNMWKSLKKQNPPPS